MSNLRQACLVILLLGFSLTARGQQASPFMQLEETLLDAAAVSFDFDIVSTGALQSHVTGSLRIRQGNQVAMHVEGTFFGEPVRLRLRTDGEDLVINDQAPAPAPAFLNESLIIGITRMGLLHNIAQLSSGLPPDHGEGGIEDWVKVPVMGRKGNRLYFEIYVAGNRAAHAELFLDGSGLPESRIQTVFFDEGQMNAKEIYSNFRVVP